MKKEKEKENTNDAETSHKHEELSDLMRQNSELIKENNQLLKKIHRNGMWSFWARITWYVIVIGLPFALYFVVRDYFDLIGADYETFKAGMQEIPGLKNLSQFQR